MSPDVTLMVETVTTYEIRENTVVLGQEVPELRISEDNSKKLTPKCIEPVIMAEALPKDRYARLGKEKIN